MATVTPASSRLPGTGVPTAAWVRRPGRWRRVGRAVAWLGLAATAAYFVGSESTPASPLDGLHLQSGLVYDRTPERDLRLDLYTPEGPAPESGWPIVLAIHGGGWSGGSRQDFGRTVGPLARHGLAIATVDYTLARPGRPNWPVNRRDVRQAVRWLRAHAAEHGLDPTRIAALGASAGGHLAAILGTDHANDRESRVQAVISLYGPTDLAHLSEPCLAPGGPVHLLLGSLPSRRPDLAKEASPLAHVSPEAAPMLLIHGTDDPLVPADQSEHLAAALTHAGVPARLLLIPGAAHGFGLVAETHNVERDVLEFLDQTWNDVNHSAESARSLQPIIPLTSDRP